MSGENERPIFCFSIKGAFICTYPNVEAAANGINYSAASIRANVNGKVKRVGDFVFSYNKKFPGYSPIKTSHLQVERLSLNNEYQKTYANVMEAAKDTGIDYKEIYRCLRVDGYDRGTGFNWRYRKKKASRGSSEAQEGKIFQFTLAGKLIDTFKSAAEAEQKTGIDATQIRRCCGKHAQTAGGFFWSRSYFAHPPKNI